MLLHSFNYITIINVMCTVLIFIDWLRQIRVMRFIAWGTISMNHCRYYLCDNVNLQYSYDYITIS